MGVGSIWRFDFCVAGVMSEIILKKTSAAMEMLKEPMPELDRSSDYEQLSLF